MPRPSSLPRAFAAIDGSAHVELVGLSSHVGSQLTQTGEYLAAAEILAGLKPLSINDGLATPMYDAFDTTADVDADPGATDTTADADAGAPAAAATGDADAAAYR